MCSNSTSIIWKTTLKLRQFFKSEIQCAEYESYNYNRFVSKNKNSSVAELAAQCCTSRILAVAWVTSL